MKRQERLLAVVGLVATFVAPAAAATKATLRDTRPQSEMGAVKGALEVQCLSAVPERLVDVQVQRSAVVAICGDRLRGAFEPGGGQRIGRLATQLVEQSSRGPLISVAEADRPDLRVAKLGLLDVLMSGRG